MNFSESIFGLFLNINFKQNENLTYNDNENLFFIASGTIQITMTKKSR